VCANGPDLDSGRLAALLRQVSREQGRLMGRMQDLGFELRREAQAEHVDSALKPIALDLATGHAPVELSNQEESKTVIAWAIHFFS